MAQEILVNIQVSSKAADNKLRKTGKEVDKIAAATKKLAYEQSEEGKSVAMLNEQYLNQRRINRQLARAKLGLTKETNKEAAGQRMLAKAKEKLNFLRSQEALELQRVNEQIKIQNNVNTAVIRSEMGLATSKASINAQGKQFRTQAGLNNAILLETGRLASDASFGFTAMANNLSQIVSLGGSFIATTGSFSTAMNQLVKSLWGVGGLLLGFQVLIGLLQSKRFLEFISTLGGVTAAMRALNKATKEATGVYGKQIGKLETLARLLEDDNVTQEQRVMILDEVKKGNKDLNIELDDQNKLTEESVKQINARIDVLKVQAETQALISAIEKERVKQIEAENKSLTESVDFYDSIIILLKNFGNAQQSAIEGVAKGEENRREEIGKSQKIIDKLYERLAQVVNFDVDNEGVGKKNRKKKFREFEEGLFRIQKIIDKYNNEADKINVRTLDERLDLEEKYAKKDADTKLANFIEAQAKRLEEYKERVAGAKNANELIRNAELDFQKSIEDARVKHGNALSAIEDGFITKRILAKDKEAQAIAKIQRSIENTEINRLRFSLTANKEYYDSKLEQVGEDKKQVDAQISNSKALKLSDLEVFKLRQESFKLQNLAIDLNLKKEIDAISEKTRVNQEYVGFVKGVSSILSTIAGENEALQKAALLIEKGAAIADIVISNTSNNIKLRAQATAAAPPPANLPFIAAAEAQILRNNIGAGIGIAGILATTLTSFKKPSGGGGSSGGGAQVQAPDFNVVGASPLDLLMVDVSNKLDKPIPAYITAKGAINTLDEYYRNVRTGSNT